MRIAFTVPVAAAVALTACVAQVTPGAGVAAAVPVASLACPTSAQVGVPFVLDGTASTGAPVEITLQVMPGPEPVAELSSTFTLAAPGIATGRLSLVDAAGLTSEARCRFAVVGEAVAIDDGDGTGDDLGDVDGGDGDDGDDTGAPPGDPVDLTGAFAMIAYDNPELTGLSLDPQRQCGAAPQLSLVELVQEGSSITMTSKTCHLSLPSVRIFAFDIQVSTVPESFIEAMPVTGPFTFDLGDIVVGTAFAPPLAAIGVPVVGGAILADPAHDVLPSDAGDERVIDSDNDGEPGVSILSSGFPQALVYRRTIRALAGVIRSADVIEGATAGSYRVDAESSLLSLFQLLVPAGTGQPSTFQMTRIADAGADGLITCDDVRAQHAALEAAFPPLDSPDDCPSF